MCAFDLPDPAQRDALLGILRDEDRILLLPSGLRSIRFRPALTISEDELAVGIKAIAGRLDRLAAERPAASAE
jgi:L-lysine 6-transaminase